VVKLLNSVFSRLDELADRLQVTKIKTMGDSYMVASGIPEYRDDHIQSLILFAGEIHRVAGSFPGLQFRVGVHTGPVVAGIIGRQRIIYDLWGDTVNVAARLEGAADPSTTLISEDVWERLPDKPVNYRRISIELKGKGVVAAYII
jgi:class 3 adenylate cyclase